MGWQEPAALAIVAVTFAVFVWRRWGKPKDFRQKTGCGCGSGPGSGSKPSIIYRARKGEAPEVLVKMN